MKALTFHGKEHIKYETVQDPTIESPHDVIVKVSLTAICGSDLHIYHEREKGQDHGTIMGHEFVGTVIEVGDEVHSFKKGDEVLSSFSTSCGECFYCRQGLTSRCIKGHVYGWVKNGVGLQGVQAEYVRVPLADSTLVAIPEHVTLEEALLLTDVFPTGYFGADAAEISPDGVYAVIGCGTVGLMGLIAAMDLGAKRIYAVDSIENRLALAQRFGATPINFMEEDPVAIIKDATNGRGADAVLEAVGSPEAERESIDIVRPGGIISVVGVPTEKHFTFSPVEAYDKNLTYKVGRCPALYYIDRLIPIVQERKYDLDSIISHRLPLHQGVNGYEIFDKKIDNCTKVLLIPSTV